MAEPFVRQALQSGPPLRTTAAQPAPSQAAPAERGWAPRGGSEEAGGAGKQRAMFARAQLWALIWAQSSAAASLREQPTSWSAQGKAFSGPARALAHVMARMRGVAGSGAATDAGWLAGLTEVETAWSAPAARPARDLAAAWLAARREGTLEGFLQRPGRQAGGQAGSAL